LPYKGTDDDALSVVSCGKIRSIKQLFTGNVTKQTRHMHLDILM